MYGLITPAAAFAAAVLLILLLRPLALRSGLTDKPGGRKQHSGEVPLIGGIAIYGAVATASIVSILLAGDGALLPEMPAFFVAAGLLLLVGIVDDRAGLSPGVRFAAEVCASAIMVYWGGVILHDLGALKMDGGVLELGYLALPFTLFATTGVINAINMSDGLDGLCGNLVLVSLLGLGIANAAWGGPEHMPLLNIVSAAVIGFLVFNQRIFRGHRAMVFLGDAGSMLLGFFLAWTAIEISQGPSAVISPAATLWFLSVPLYDTGCVMIRRILQARSPFNADNHHLHHLLIRAGLSVGESIGTICLLAAAGCLIGLAGVFFRIPDTQLALGFLIGALIYCLIIGRAWRRGQLFGRSITAS